MERALGTVPGGGREREPELPGRSDGAHAAIVSCLLRQGAASCTATGGGSGTSYITGYSTRHRSGSYNKKQCSRSR